MGREALDATATAIATRAALAAVVVAAVVILPAVLAGILDHLGRARRLAAVLGRISPPIARRTAASCIAVIAMTSWVGPASAVTSGDRRAPSVRDWLEGPATTSEGPAAPSGTWYPDPADPTGDSGPHGTVGLDDLDARTTTSTVATTTTTRPAPTTTTRRPATRRPRRPSTTTSSPARIPLPYAGTQPADGTPSAPAAPEPADTYTVVPGDCLWTIAAHRLPPTAPASDIDRAWRAIYVANRSVVGSNPNLILPGQVLVLPPLPTSA